MLNSRFLLRGRQSINLCHKYFNGTIYRQSSSLQNPSKNNAKLYYSSLGTISVLTAGFLLFYQRKLTAKVDAEEQKSEKSENVTDESKRKKRRPGEARFRNFASLEFEGEPFMTPRDFLDSVIQDRPRPRIKTKVRNSFAKTSLNIF